MRYSRCVDVPVVTNMTRSESSQPGPAVAVFEYLHELTKLRTKSTSLRYGNVNRVIMAFGEAE